MPRKPSLRGHDSQDYAPVLPGTDAEPLAQDQDRRRIRVQSMADAYRLIEQHHLRLSDQALAGRIIQAGLQAQSDQYKELTAEVAKLREEIRTLRARKNHR